MKMSQEKLGDALGLTFQQVQKYEKGTNRIGASRLQQISKTLNVPPSFFFEGAPSSSGEPQQAFQEEGSQYVVDFLATAEGLHLNRSFARLRDPKVRKRIVELVAALAEFGRSGTLRPRHARRRARVMSFSPLRLDVAASRWQMSQAWRTSVELATK